MAEHRMFGLWDSPITARSLAAGLRLGEPCWDTNGETLGWVEGRSDRGLIVVLDRGGGTRDLTPADLSVRAFVGYGGGDFTLAHGSAYFVGQADQRLYRQEIASGLPRPLTPPFGAASTPVVSPDGRWVAYVHSFEDRDCIAICDTDGQHWPRRLAEGRDFYMQPAWHPDGRRLAWIEWDHPHMPWEEATLVVGSLDLPDDGLPVLRDKEQVAGGAGVAPFQPLFSADGGRLCWASDDGGIGHVYARDLASGETKKLTTGEGDFCRPAWGHAMRTLAVSAAALVGVRNTLGFDTLEVISEDGEASAMPLDPRYTSITAPVAAPDGRIAVVAAGGTQPPRVAIVHLENSAPSVEVVRRSDGESVPPEALSQPEAVSWTGADGETVHGLFYPPHNPRFTAEGPAPLIVMVHGGPTSQAVASWRPEAQFFATRGYGVLYPNYRGSTGYGRAYMERLRERWGDYDVHDCRTGAQALADRGIADGERLVIMGGSAGGYTVLQSLVDIPGFYRAGVCMYGVSNQFTLAADTHKFESHYSEWLLGRLPEAAGRYRDRSPLFHADRIQDPVALFQGDIDRVVVRSQSDSIAASLRARGVPHEYHVYEGEGHGWRKAETIEHFYNAVARFLREQVLFA